MKLWSKLRSLFGKGKLDAEMAEEMRLHLELQTEKYLAAGMNAEEARHAARREFGGLEQIKEQCREQRGWVWLEMLNRDLMFTARRLRRTPAFTVTALMTLALCVGANTVIFSAVNAVVLRPLPFPKPERLVRVLNSYPGLGYPRAAPSIPNYFARREAIRAFANVALWQPVGEDIGGPGNVRRVDAARVTPDFFATLGVPLALGHMFTDAELTYQTGGVVILTDELWRSQCGADPDIIGKTLIVGGGANTIIGVLPRGFRFLSTRAQFFKPLAFNPDERELANRHKPLPGTIMIARLATGATLPEALAQLNALDAREAKIDPSGAFLKEWDYHSIVLPLHDDYVREIRPVLLLLQGGVAILLAIGAVNLTNLLLVRTSGRSRELAVRQALGALPSRLAREAWLEATMLALCGSILGCGLGAAGVRLLATLGSEQLPLGATISIDGWVIAVVLVGALILGGLLAVLPIWFMRRLPINSRLQSEGPSDTVGKAAQKIRQYFGVVQVALAFVLLSGAGLLGLSLRRALAQPVGFKPDHVLTGGINLGWKKYRTPWQRIVFMARIERTLSGLPGVSGVSFSNYTPFSGSTEAGPAVVPGFTADGTVAIEGRAGDVSATARGHHHAAVAGDYWRVMGIPFLRGKPFENEFNSMSHPRVCIIDQAVANAYWRDSDPIGQRLSFGASFDPSQAITVVGVVGTVKQEKLTETQPMGTIYSPYVEYPISWFRAVLRTQLPPAAMAETLRKVVEKMDPELVVTPIITMEQMIDDSLLARRSPAILAAIFAGIALVLATVGTYGVLACAVSYRRREIGIRMALGALPEQIVRLFLNMGARLLLGGCILGLAVAWATGRAMQRFLFEVGSFSPLVMGGVSALMAGVVFTAIIIPAVRAAAVDPCETLRHD